MPELENYLDSDQGAIKLLKRRMFKKAFDYGEAFHDKTEDINWILKNREGLETFMLNGDIFFGSWKKAFETFAAALKERPDAKSGWKLQLAATTGLSFSSPVHFRAYSDETVDPIPRFNLFVKLAEDRTFYEPFYNLSAWHMRFVINSSQKDKEITCAQANVPQSLLVQKVLENILYGRL